MTAFRLRKIELREGGEVMLRKAKWLYDGPAKHPETEKGRYWISPHTGYKYTMSAAIDVEELREAWDDGA